MPYRNLAREYSTTTGTSDCVLTGAVPGCNTWELAGITNGEVVRFGIITYSLTNNRPTHSEISLGAYNTATNTVARTTVESSTNAGAKIVLTGLSEVYICPSRKDLPVFASYYGSTLVVNDTVDNALLDVDTEWTDEHGLATLAADVITINYPCWASISMHVTFDAASAFNGYVHVECNQYGQGTRKGYTTAMGILADTIFLGPFLFNVTTTQAVSFQFDNHLGANANTIINDVQIEAWLK